MSLLLAALLFVPLPLWDVCCRAVLLHPMGTAKLLSSPPFWQCCATGFNYYLTWDSEIPHYLAYLFDESKPSFVGENDYVTLRKQLKARAPDVFLKDS